MVAQPLSIPPSEVFEGNDGPWSSFVVRIGTPPQETRMLPASSQSCIWAVWTQTNVNGTITGCPHGSPDDCDTLRGIMFDPLNSTSFNVAQDQYQGFHELPFESEQGLPGYNGTCEVGSDDISIIDGQTIPAQVIANYIVPNPFLGQLGLSARPNHISSYVQSNQSTLATLQNSSQIPSQYYAYNAGAPYRTPQAFGSLTFGGYDSMRGNVDGVLTQPFQEPTSRDLTLVLSSITISNQTAQTQVPGLGIPAFIDSMVPEIWLPEASCTAFEAAFNLTWNETYSMYLVSDTQHDQLVSENATVEFSLSATSDSSNATKITLPYASFDLKAGYPLAGITDDSTVRYFPLKRGSNSSQYILGRTFLQEAYLTVDYDRQQFSVSQATFPAQQASTSIVAVHPPKTGSSGGLSGGAIAGIVVGVVVPILLILLGAWFWFRRRRRQRRRRESQTTRTASIGPLSTLVAGDEMGEYYHKPPLPVEEDDSKAELDAQATARGSPNERHELEAESVRAGNRPSPHETVSWGSGISSITERMGGQSMAASIASPQMSATSPHMSVSSPPSHHDRGMSIEERGELHEMG